MALNFYTEKTSIVFEFRERETMLGLFCNCFVICDSCHYSAILDQFQTIERRFFPFPGPNVSSKWNYCWRKCLLHFCFASFRVLGSWLYSLPDIFNDDFECTMTKKIVVGFLKSKRRIELNTVSIVHRSTYIRRESVNENDFLALSSGMKSGKIARFGALFDRITKFAEITI